jgi:glycosidase
MLQSTKTFPVFSINTERAAVSAAPLVLPTVPQSAYTVKGVAYPDQTLSLSLCISRKWGISHAQVRFWHEDSVVFSAPLSFMQTERDIDTYSLEVDVASLLCGRTDDFLQYEILLQHAKEQYISYLTPSGNITWETQGGSPLRLLVVDRSYQTPDWLKNGIMYHIFVDRYAKGAGFSQYAQNSVYNPDWENGIPPYAKKAGDPLDNNVFFGGNLWGIAEHLDEMQALGVNILYLSPIFRAYSNHKYDTGDYLKVDDGFGGEAALQNLIDCAHARGMRIILDGVFNHTGDDSRYFNRYGNYDGVGAFQSQESPYYSWYRFKSFPYDYESWWGIMIMPRLDASAPTCRSFFLGEDGVIAHYLKMGIDGWRLDVADELSDDFLDGLRAIAKKTKPDSAIIGEVWENAATKTSYGTRRKYLRGSQLDSVMNYPFRTGVLEYLRCQDATRLANPLCELYHDYPRCACDALMNLLGTHDTERILTLLGESQDVSHFSNDDFAHHRLSQADYARGKQRLKLASVLQYTVYGFPSLFYADEAGMEGYHDPFCRRPYPWHCQDSELLTHYRKLGALRQRERVFNAGEFRVLCAEGGLFCFERVKGSERIVIATNVSSTPRELPLTGKFTDLYTNKVWDHAPLFENEFVILK